MREAELRHLVHTRTHRPQAIAEAAETRLPARSPLGEHGRLMIIAADHPARGALRAGREPLVSNDLTPEAMIRAITVASGLGNTSAYTCLKVPYVEDMERVMAASTLPALILGGEVSPDQNAVIAAWRKTLELSTVRGFVIGRSLLFPPDDNVPAAVDAVVEML